MKYEEKEARNLLNFIEKKYGHWKQALHHFGMKYKFMCLWSLKTVFPEVGVTETNWTRIKEDKLVILDLG